MQTLVFRTNNATAPLIIRIFLAIVLFPHGAQKLLGWFGGYGFEDTMQYFSKQVGMHWSLGFLVIVIEFFGPLFLLAGFAVRLWSFAITVIMVGIIVTHFTEYFFMNFFGHQKTEGMEFFLLMIGMAVSLVISGAGRWSLDSFSMRSLVKR